MDRTPLLPNPEDMIRSTPVENLPSSGTCAGGLLGTPAPFYSSSVVPANPGIHQHGEGDAGRGSVPASHKYAALWAHVRPWICDIIGVFCLFGMLFFGLFLELFFS